MTASQPPADNELREAMAAEVANGGACCGQCGREPGDPLAECPDCARCVGWYADAALAVVAAHASQQQEAVERVRAVAVELAEEGAEAAVLADLYKQRGHWAEASAAGAKSRHVIDAATRLRAALAGES